MQVIGYRTQEETSRTDSPGVESPPHPDALDYHLSADNSTFRSRLPTRLAMSTLRIIGLCGCMSRWASRCRPWYAACQSDAPIVHGKVSQSRLVRQFRQPRIGDGRTRQFPGSQLRKQSQVLHPCIRYGRIA